MVDCFNDDHLTLNLFGEKRVGVGALTYFRNDNGKRQWLTVNMDADAADVRRNPVRTLDTSVRSHRTIPEIARHEGPQGVEGGDHD